MPIVDNKFLTYADLQWLIDNEGFYPKSSFTPSLRIADKAGIETSVRVLAIDPTYVQNRWVSRVKVISQGTAWIGDESDWECLDDASSTGPPTSPTNLAASNITQNSMNLTWTASTDPDGDLAGYIIYWRILDPLFGFAQIDVGLVTSFSMLNLVENTTYEIYVIAYDLENNYSGWSNVIQPITLAPTQTPLTLSISNTGDSLWDVVVNGDNGTNYTWEITVFNGGDIVAEYEWYYKDDLSVANKIEGNTSPSLPITLTGTSNTIDANLKDVAATFGTNVSTPGHWAKANFKILNAVGYTNTPQITVNIGVQPTVDLLVEVEDHGADAYSYVYVTGRNNDIINGNVSITADVGTNWIYYNVMPDLSLTMLVQQIDTPTIPGVFSIPSRTLNGNREILIQYRDARPFDGGTTATFEITNSSMGSVLPPIVDVSIIPIN